MNAERVGVFFWAAVGLITIYGSFHLGLGTLREPGPGFLAFVAGCFIFFLAIIDILLSILLKKRDWTKLSTLWADVNWHRPLIILLVTLGFILVLQRLGFILSGFLVMFSIFKWVERMSWGKSIIIPVVTLSLTYLVFGFLLKSNLPKGILGF
jgi:putative tricarboxylic transport membrane protein